MLTAGSKNVRLQMGRCPVRSIFHEAMELLEQEQKALGYVLPHRVSS